MARSVKNGDFYNRIGAVALLTAQPDEGTETSDPVGLTLETDQFLDGKVLEGLNFRFRFEYKEDMATGHRGTGSVGILGLNSNTIREWASAEFPDANKKKSRYIRVYAGYEKDGSVSDCELFTAQYLGAQPTPPPEMWLNFDVATGISALSSKVLNSQDMFLSGTFVPGAHKGTRSPYATRETYQTSFGVTIHQACSRLATSVAKGHYGYKPVADEADNENFFLTWRISEELEKRLPVLRCVDFSSKTPEEAVELINSWGVVRARWQEDKEDMLVSSFWGAQRRTRVVPRLVVWPNFEDFKFDTALKPPFVIDEDAGMVGIPHFGMEGAKSVVTVKCLMRRDIGMGDIIKPVSKYMKNTTHEYYQVNTVIYEGELRGQPWYVTYKGFGVDSLEAAEAAKKAKEEEQKRAEEANKSTVSKSMDAMSSMPRLR